MSGSGQPGGSSYTRPSCSPPSPHAAPGSRWGQGQPHRGCGTRRRTPLLPQFPPSPLSALHLPPTPVCPSSTHPAPRPHTMAPHHGPTSRPHIMAPHHGPRQPLHNERRGAVTHAASAGPRAQHHARSGWLPVVGAGGKATSCPRGLKIQVPSSAVWGPSSCTAGVLQQWGWEEG